MTGKNIITLVDLDDQTRYFTAESLLSQMAAADIPATAPIKTVAKNLATAVREMREAQKDYFKSQYGSTEKLAALNRSKAAEGKVDKMLAAIDHTLNWL